MFRAGWLLSNSLYTTATSRWLPETGIPTFSIIYGNDVIPAMGGDGNRFHLSARPAPTMNQATAVDQHSPFCSFRNSPLGSDDISLNSAGSISGLISTANASITLQHHSINRSSARHVIFSAAFFWTTRQSHGRFFDSSLNKMTNRGYHRGKCTVRPNRL